MGIALFSSICDAKPFDSLFAYSAVKHFTLPNFPSSHYFCFKINTSAYSIPSALFPKHPDPFE